MSEPHPDEQKPRERRVARKLREQLALPEALVERVNQRLELAERSELKRARDARTSFLRRARTHLFLLMPGAISVALALFVNVQDPAFDAMLTAEHHLSLSSEGFGTLSLSLALHEHDDASAKVALVVPTGVHITALSDKLEGDLAPACANGRCRYEFEHPPESESPHVAVHVSKPGSYRMEVEHSSSSARVREVVVIHARR